MRSAHLAPGLASGMAGKASLPPSCRSVRLTSLPGHARPPEVLFPWGVRLWCPVLSWRLRLLVGAVSVLILAGSLKWARCVFSSEDPGLEWPGGSQPNQLSW